jgi:hypothetical protein
MFVECVVASLQINVVSQKTCCGFVNRSAIGVGVWRFVEGGEHGRAIWDGGSTSLPSFRSRNGGETLNAAIIHIWQQVLSYNDEVGCFAMRLAVCLSRSSRAPPRRLIKAPGVGITVVPGRIQYGVLD